jgi:hypothetical protein
MKLNYRDKIIAGVLLAIVILLVGFFVPVKNMNKQNKADKKILAEKEKIKADYEAKIAKIPSIQESIRGLYAEASDATKIFIPVEEVQSQVKVDNYMQKYADECKIKIKNLELGSTTVSPLSYYYTSQKDAFSKLRSQADVNGTLQEAYDASVAESTALSQRSKENVIKTQYAMKITGTKENIWKYLEAMKNFDKAVVVNSVTLSDYTFGKDAAKKAGVEMPESKDGDEVSVQAGDKVIKNISDAQIVLSLYSVIEMEEPDVEMK